MGHLWSLFRTTHRASVSAGAAGLVRGPARSFRTLAHGVCNAQDGARPQCTSSSIGGMLWVPARGRIRRSCPSGACTYRRWVPPPGSAAWRPSMTMAPGMVVSCSASHMPSRAGSCCRQAEGRQLGGKIGLERGTVAGRAAAATV